jgi:hypothetical protein
MLKAAGKVVSWRSIYTARAKLALVPPTPPQPPPPVPLAVVPSGIPGVAHRPARRGVGGPAVPLFGPGSLPRFVPPGPAPGDALEHAGEVDAEGTPLEVARQLLAKATNALHKLDADSPRRNPAATECRNLAKMIAALEKQAGEKETPESIERRRRQADHETRREILQYVEQAEARAAEPRPGAPHGVCVTCGAARAEAEA